MADQMTTQTYRGSPMRIALPISAVKRKIVIAEKRRRIEEQLLLHHAMGHDRLMYFRATGDF
jgi:hypothetical protein